MGRQGVVWGLLAMIVLSCGAFVGAADAKPEPEPGAFEIVAPAPEAIAAIRARIVAELDRVFSGDERVATLPKGVELVACIPGKPPILRITIGEGEPTPIETLYKALNTDVPYVLVDRWRTHHYGAIGPDPLITPDYNQAATILPADGSAPVAWPETRTGVGRRLVKMGGRYLEISTEGLRASDQTVVMAPADELTTKAFYAIERDSVQEEWNEHDLYMAVVRYSGPTRADGTQLLVIRITPAGADTIAYPEIFPQAKCLLPPGADGRVRAIVAGSIVSLDAQTAITHSMAAAKAFSDAMTAGDEAIVRAMMPDAMLWDSRYSSRLKGPQSMSSILRELRDRPRTYDGYEYESVWPVGPQRSDLTVLKFRKPRSNLYRYGVLQPDLSMRWLTYLPTPKASTQLPADAPIFRLQFDDIATLEGDSLVALNLGSGPQQSGLPAGPDSHGRLYLRVGSGIQYLRQYLVLDSTKPVSDAVADGDAHKREPIWDTHWYPVDKEGRRWYSGIPRSPSGRPLTLRPPVKQTGEFAWQTDYRPAPAKRGMSLLRAEADGTATEFLPDGIESGQHVLYQPMRDGVLLFRTHELTMLIIGQDAWAAPTLDELIATQASLLLKYVPEHHDYSATSESLASPSRIYLTRIGQHLVLVDRDERGKNFDASNRCLRIFDAKGQAVALPNIVAEMLANDPLATLAGPFAGDPSLYYIRAGYRAPADGHWLSIKDGAPITVVSSANDLERQTTSSYGKLFFAAKLGVQFSTRYDKLHILSGPEKVHTIDNPYGLQAVLELPDGRVVFKGVYDDTYALFITDGHRIVLVPDSLTRDIQFNWGDVGRSVFRTPTGFEILEPEGPGLRWTAVAPATPR